MGLAVQDVAAILSRYGDFMAIVSVLPLLSDLKFGKLVRLHRIRKERMDREAAETEKLKDGGTKAVDDKADKSKSSGKKQESKQAAAKKEEKDAKKLEEQEAKLREADEAAAEEEVVYPPFWGFFFLLLAEICANLNFLDANDKTAARAMGTVYRLQENTESGFSNAITAVEKCIINPDVYALLKFSSSMVVLGTMSLLALTKVEGGARGRLRKARGYLDQYLGEDWQNKLLMVLFVMTALVSYGVANLELLRTLVKKSVVKQFLESAVPLLRSSGLLCVAFLAKGPTQGEDSPLSPWAMTSAVACLSRIFYVIIRERLTWATLFTETVSGADINLGTIRCTLALEVFTLLALGPHFFQRWKYQILTGLLLLPLAFCRLGASGATSGGAPFELTHMIFGLVNRLSLALVLICGVYIFLGGLRAIAIVALHVQLMNYIHGLDKLKY